MPPDINAIVADARRRFRAAGISHDEAALDARLLAQHVLGWSAATLLTHGDETMPDTTRAAYEGLVLRRIEREPLAYIVGVREFWNLDIEVNRAVLIPRPETELLVEAAVDICDRTQPLRIADVCTGSGCLAVALGREFPRASLVASDTSDAALAVANRNLSRHGMLSRAQCIQADLFHGLPHVFDLIVANPPYVPTVDASGLQPEVRRFEPALALFAGENGLQVIRRLVQQAPEALASDGFLMFEFGAGQAEAVESAVAQVGSLSLIDVRRDLQDLPRVAIVQKTGHS
jgi:release factor glutamine methyltransferase